MTVEDDIKEIKEQLKALGHFEVSLARIEQYLKDHPRPCVEFSVLEKQCTEHFEAHKKTTQTWKSALVGKAVDLAAMVLVALVTAALVAQFFVH